MRNLLLSSSFKAGLGYGTFALIAVFLVGLINAEHKLLGIDEPLFPVTDVTALFLDAVFWTIAGLLTLELVLVYVKTGNRREFARKYWLEILLLVLMPVFAGFKFLKITLKILKQLKVAKTGLKLVQKLKK